MTGASSLAWHEAELFLDSELSKMWAEVPEAELLAARILHRTGIRIIDIVDHVCVASGERIHEGLGWNSVATGVWRHASGLLPDVLEGRYLQIALRVDDVEAIVRAVGVETKIEGPAGGQYRRASLFARPHAALVAVERHGWPHVHLAPSSPRQIRRARRHLQIFRSRRRHFTIRPEAALRQLEPLVAAAVTDLGPAWASDIFVRAELEFWEGNCQAGVLQSWRQKRAGLGWANLDHLAYYCSRAQSDEALALFGALGFAQGETIWTGDEIGVGGRVLRHTQQRSAAIVLESDFADYELASTVCPDLRAPLTWYCRAGLWQALHGESLFEGGPVRVAGRYDAEAFCGLMRGDGIDPVSPYSARANSHLAQLITSAQTRAVAPLRIEAIRRKGYLGRNQAEALTLKGASGSHLQCVERRAGFAGFEALAPDFGFEGICTRTTPERRVRRPRLSMPRKGRASRLGAPRLGSEA
jgi:hypothetical protein